MPCHVRGHHGPASRRHRAGAAVGLSRRPAEERDGAGAAILGPAGVRAGRALHLLFLVQPAVSGLSFLRLAQQAPPAAPAGALSSEAETTGREAGYAQS